MQLDRTRAGCAPQARLSIRLAKSAHEIELAQRLRWTVFADEQGANLNSPRSGLDIDRFDAHCDHMIVTAVETGQVVGTYRLLTADAAAQCGGYYSQREFDLDRLTAGPLRLLEIGRSCVHPDFRTGSVIALLWSGIATYLMQSKHDALIGCASISLQGDANGAFALAHELAARHPATEQHRVVPRQPAPSVDATLVRAAIPPLLKGYLRCGAVVCGAPYWDRAFKSADLFLFLAVADVEARYARRFMPQTGEDN
jgi:putative hemolysin